jgi:aminoglycoside/choline kinase family phosphotransferase
MKLGMHSSPLSKKNELNNATLDSVYRIEKFLEHVGFNLFKIEEIANDCSAREYYRIYHNNESFILMDASKDMASVEPYIKVTRILIDNSFSAPKIIASNLNEGFLLLEDFGNNSFTKYLKTHIKDEKKVYKHAMDALVYMREVQVMIDVPAYADDMLEHELVSRFVEWHLDIKLEKSKAQDAKAELLEIFREYFKELVNIKPVLVMSDYMADNLFYLKGRDSFQKVGIIDFQDAVIGSPAYDVVSLIEDARREKSLGLDKLLLDYYLNRSPKIDQAEFLKSYRILSAQRNLKIVGVFSRMAVKFNRPKYARYLPQVWSYVLANLEYGEVAKLKAWFLKYDIPTN